MNNKILYTASRNLNLYNHFEKLIDSIFKIYPVFTSL